MNDEIKANMVANIVTELSAPSPEQLQAWHEDFEKSLPIGERHRLPSQGYASFRIEFEWRGYLRAKQENEQVMKLAKFAVKVLQVDWTDEGGISEWELERGAKASGLCNSDGALLPNIEATIKGLLND